MFTNRSHGKNKKVKTLDEGKFLQPSETFCSIYFCKILLKLVLNEIRNYNFNLKLISIIIILLKVLSDFTLVVMCTDHTLFFAYTFLLNKTTKRLRYISKYEV